MKTNRQSALARLTRDIKQRSIYLMDREGYIEDIFDRIRKDIAFVPIVVTGVSGTGYDIRGIGCNIPAEYVAIFLNKNHAKLDFYKDHTHAAKKLGYASKFSNDVKKNYPMDYEERYKQFGFQCGVETVYCSESGDILGLWAGIKKAEAYFCEDEMAAIKALSPFVFYAFLRYKWLVQSDLFTVVCFDEFPYGILTVDEDLHITYINEPARQMFRMVEKSAPQSLPQQLSAQIRRLEEIARHKDDAPCLAFQEIETYIPLYGVAMCYRFDEAHGGKYLPVKGKGYVFFIDSRQKDMAQKALLSPRELDVIRLVGRGLQDKEIAHELGISEKTVQTYMQKLFVKLETQNRTEAAVKAIRLGLL